ncbi:hypothetical protein [uncultured Stenotrophomonas sp.]|uniref:hypothetical protein n=1 Tax=uncultured Stenotrophomonas sp. TaxID=165438 RepID=UPI0025F95874|nr:hypothetical protein [uncultured Stenotrophomonas sp.]
MFTIDARQEALLRLPDPFDFMPRLAREIRRDLPDRVLGLNDAALLRETARCYDFATHALGITNLPVLVAWTKTDVGSGGELYRSPQVDMAVRNACQPSVKAADILGALAAMNRWPEGDA